MLSSRRYFAVTHSNSAEEANYDVGTDSVTEICGGVLLCCCSVIRQYGVSAAISTESLHILGAGDQCCWRHNQRGGGGRKFRSDDVYLHSPLQPRRQYLYRCHGWAESIREQFFNHEH